MIVQDAVAVQFSTFFRVLVESSGNSQSHCGRYLFGSSFADTLARIDHPHCILTHSGFFCQCSTCSMRQQLEQSSSRRKRTVLPDALLFEIIVERHQVRWFYFGHLQVPQTGGDPWSQPFIIVQGLGLEMLVGVFLKPPVNEIVQQHIRVQCHAVRDLLFKPHRLLLYPLFNLLSAHSRRWDHGLAPRDDLV